MGKLKRYLVVRKMCGTRHSMYKYPFEITEMEIIVFPSGKIYQAKANDFKILEPDL